MLLQVEVNALMGKLTLEEVQARLAADIYLSSITESSQFSFAPHRCPSELFDYSNSTPSRDVKRRRRLCTHLNHGGVDLLGQR